MNCKVPLEEQETTINIYPARISRKADVYSCIPSTVDRLKKLATDRPDAVKIVADTGYSVMAEVERSCVKIIPKRLMSEEERLERAERLRLNREKKVTS